MANSKYALHYDFPSPLSAVCRYCSPTVTLSRTKGTTSSLRSHLQTAHKDLLLPSKVSHSCFVPAIYSMAQTNFYTCLFQSHANEVEETCARLIASSSSSLTLIQNRHLLALLSKDVRLLMPSTKTLTRRVVPALAEKVRQEVDQVR